MKTLFGTVLYQSAFKYAADLINSINQQDTDDFEVLIINDDIDSEVLENALHFLSKDYSVIQYSQKYSPVELRIKLFSEAKRRRADLLVMGDADDEFSKNRMSNLIRIAENNPEPFFFYNKIEDFDGHQMMPDMPGWTKGIGDILSYNYLGMSNTGMRVGKLSDEFIISLDECKSPIFDWYLFSRILLDGKEGMFVPGAVTYYRLYEGNIVGDQESNPERIEYEVSVKKQHYELLESRSDIIRQMYLNYINEEYKVCTNCQKRFWWGCTEPLR